MLIVTAIALAITVISAVKCVDFVASIWFLSRTRDTPLTRGLDWTPIFAWAQKTRSRWEKDGRLRDKLVALLIGVLFRGPVLALSQAVVLLCAFGTLPSNLAGDGAHCAVPRSPTATVHSLSMSAAIGCVVIAMMPIAHPLLARVLRPQEDARLIAGQFTDRSGVSMQEGRALSFILTVPLITVALFTSYAALYLALYLGDHGSFSMANCSLDPIGALYFSTATAATVGYGDITASSDVARLLVVSEIIVFVTFFALYIQDLASYRQ